MALIKCSLAICSEREPTGINKIKIKAYLLLLCSQWTRRFLPSALEEVYMWRMTVVCFLVPGGKVACLKPAECLFRFYVKHGKDIFISGWICGTHISAFPVSEQLEKHRICSSLLLTWWAVLALTTHASRASGQVLTMGSAGTANIIMGALEEGGVTNLLPEVTLALSAREWSVRQGAPEVLTHGSFSCSWFSLYLL